MFDAFSLSKILFLATLSFLLAFALTPILTHFLYKYRMGKSIRSAVTAPMFAKMHAKKAGVPTMGGILMWATPLILAAVFFVIFTIDPGHFLGRLNFLSRAQTWLPMFALVSAGLIGLIDDYLNVRGIGPQGGGIHIRHRLVLYTIVAAIGAWWFFTKLDWSTIHIPFLPMDIELGWWYIPVFIAVIVGTSFSVNQTDGLDGLAGGTLASAFGAYAIIAMLQGQMDLAAFCAVVMGALLAFLWFNIFPARFIMGDTGAMSLGVTLGVVAMLTDSALLLPIIGAVFVWEAITTLIQLASKKLFGKKVFLIAPIHHHFEAKGWPEPKVVMRFWLISWVAAAVGLIVALLDQALRVAA